MARGTHRWDSCPSCAQPVDDRCRCGHVRRSRKSASRGGHGGGHPAPTSPGKVVRCLQATERSSTSPWASLRIPGQLGRLRFWPSPGPGTVLPVAELVSVIVPVHNGEQHLEQGVRSALGQTYENLEVI